MSIRPFIVLIALLLTVTHSLRAQVQPLQVEVLDDSHSNFDPIMIRVTNTASMSINLALPANVLKNKETLRNPLPMDVEKHAGNRWVITRPEGHGGVGRTIKPGQTLTFALGISGTGEYRVRVWYFVDPGDPPNRKPVFGSAVSEAFQIIQSN